VFGLLGDVLTAIDQRRLQQHQASVSNLTVLPAEIPCDNATEQLITRQMSQPPRAQAPGATSRLSTFPSQKPRQLSHLHAQLAQLTAHVSDLENLLRVTAVQAESMRNLGGYAGALYVFGISYV
jgi:preprotein translocase subunit SecD